jgi:hypothetical protein
MRTSGCNREENWQKIGLLAYNCEGKNEGVIKNKTNVNKFRCQVQVWDIYEAVF